MLSQRILNGLTRVEALSCQYISVAISGASLASYNANHKPKPNPSIATFSTQPTPEKGIITQVLQNQCGLTETDITTAFRHCSKLLNMRSTESLEKIVQLLKDSGLSKAQIRTAVINNPRLLQLNAENNLKPKIDFLRTFVQEEHLRKIISAEARIFNMNLDHNMKTTVSLLREYGFEGNALSELLAKQPRMLTTSAKHIREAFELPGNLGFTKGSKMFFLAFRVIISVGKDNTVRKLQNLQGLGFSEEQVKTMCRRLPHIMGITEENVKRTMDFINSVSLPLTNVVKYPVILSCGFETRLIPRYRVIEALNSMGLPKKPRNFPRSLLLSEKDFLKKYVDSYAESSMLHNIYKGVQD